MSYKNDDLKSIDYLGNSLFIKWYMTDWCNYHCPYCLHASHTSDTLKEKINQSKIEEKARNINRILKQNNINKKLFFRFIGGEPTLYNLKPVIDCFDLPICNICIVTNFFRPIDYFKELYSFCASKNIKLNLTLSHHDENVNFFDKALQLTNWCNENGYNVPEINVVVTPDFDTDFVDKYIAQGLTKIRVVRERNGLSILNSEVSQEKIDWLEKVNKLNRSNRKSRGSYLITFKDGSTEYRPTLSDFTAEFDYGGLITDGRYCSTGVDAIFIRTDDNIYTGCCAYTGFDFVIGNIYNESVILPKEPILCKLNEKNKNAARCMPCYHLHISDVVDKDLYEAAKNK